MYWWMLVRSLEYHGNYQWCILKVENLLLNFFNVSCEMVQHYQVIKTVFVYHQAKIVCLDVYELLGTNFLICNVMICLLLSVNFSPNIWSLKNLYCHHIWFKNYSYKPWLYRLDSAYDTVFMWYGRKGREIVQLKFEGKRKWVVKKNEVWDK